MVWVLVNNNFMAHLQHVYETLDPQIFPSRQSHRTLSGIQGILHLGTSNNNSLLSHESSKRHAAMLY